MKPLLVVTALLLSSSAHAATLNGTLSLTSDASVCGVGSCNFDWSTGTISGNINFADFIDPSDNLLIGTIFADVGIRTPSLGPYTIRSWDGSSLSLRNGSLGMTWTTLDLVFDFTNETFTSQFFYGADRGSSGHISATWNGVGTIVTPLPSAIILFLTGLGALAYGTRKAS